MIRTDAPLFDGRTFIHELDGGRLGKQLQVVRALMLDGQWRTLGEISEATGYGEASVSARLRDCRKERFGGHQVQRRRRGDGRRGLFEYRIIYCVKDGGGAWPAIG
jgi:hypothetical protein